MTTGSICFEVFTLFPAAIEGFAGAGLLGKAIEQGRVTVRCTDFREFTSDRHRTVDDAPFGGGAGMVIKPGPVVDAMEHVARERGPFHRVLLTPSAPRFDQAAAARLARMPRVGLLCGRYEGIDDRVREHFVDECLSLGDFVLGGGEVAALVIIEAVSRLCEGVVGNPESIHTDSFGRTGEAPLLEHPQYTRPAQFRGHPVPPVLLGGDHAAIARWRHAAALRRTWALRPDLRPRPRLPPEHPVYLAVPPAALPEAAALADVVRRHGATGLVVVGPQGDPTDDRAERQVERQVEHQVERQVERWLRATAGRISVASFADAKALRRRLQRGAAAEPRFVRVVEPGTLHDPAFAELGPACERPEALLDLLGAASGPVESPPRPAGLGPLVLWVHPQPPPSGMPIHAIYAPPRPSAGSELERPRQPDGAEGPASTEAREASAGPEGHDLTSPAVPEIAPGLAIADAIADISRPFPRPASLADAALTGLRDRG
jgi:tRNA (guanine-N1)-methyltransferase